MVKKDGRRKVVSHSFSIPISPEGVERIQKDIEENTAPYRQELIMKRRGIENPQDLPPAFKEGEVWVRATVRADYNIPDVPNTGVLGMLIDERTFNLFLTNCTSFALRSLSQANPQYRKLFGEVLMEEDHPVFRAIVMFKCFCLSVLAGIVRHVKDGENRDKRHIDGILHNALRHSEEARLFDEMIAIVPPDGLVDILARDEDNAVFSAEAEVVAELNRMALATRVD